MQDSKNYNVIEQYKSWAQDLIREDLKKKAYPYAVMMFNLSGDFNFGTVVRNANAFGASEIFYHGKKKWDRRSALGTYHYFPVTFLPTWQEVLDLKQKYTFIAMEISEKSCLIGDFEWPKNSLIIIGEEATGIPGAMIGLCDYVVTIPQVGSVRSINAGCASAIAMYDYISKFES